MLKQLELFHPLIRKWFLSRIGRPTDVQSQAWPGIAAGENVLVIAPTGSGKTLTAFLWALNQLISGAWPAGRTRVLYVSPLKALNNDIRRNLTGPLDELKAVFEEQGQPFPAISVQTRSGDTPQSERQRMFRRPPEILITTPESLNLLLSSAGGLSILTSLRAVILDEIHAVFGTKRGVHLITAVDRLVRLSGEFQRVALSATVRPAETVAEFVGGLTADDPGSGARRTPRPVRVIRSSVSKKYDISVNLPEEAEARPNDESLWKPLVAEFKKIIGRNRSTLIFANSRRFTEKLTLKINNAETRVLAYAHHGSLSREIRTAVEQKLKAGDLKAIVATNSLELGIDIGALDEVLLFQSPGSVSSAVQRVGRAGHRVGETSRGTIYPTFSHDFLEAAVLARCIGESEIEAGSPVDSPLDVLAQAIVSMVLVETRDIDEMYEQIICSHPYRNLSRRHFDLVLNMLAGRYADARVRELKPRVSLDRLDNTAAAVRGARLVLYSSGGTIPDRGYFHLRHFETNSLIGELDEEYVWEASVGQTFSLGAQNWKIERITHNDVFVRPALPRIMDSPFWRGDEIGRDFHFSQRIGLFLEEADTRLTDPAFINELQTAYHMNPPAARALASYLKNQKEATGAALPHRHHLLIEHVHSGPGGAPGNQSVLHTGWGLRVNRPLALALEAAWESNFGGRIETFAANDQIVLMLPHDISGAEILSLVDSASLDDLLRRKLEGSGFFGARFRECAGRALLLPRRKFNERMPLWMSRLRSQKLLEAIKSYEDFPILLEAWRTCLQDEFDLDSLRTLLAEIESGTIAWSEVASSTPSPMARNVTYRQVNQYMYMSDEPASDRRSSLSAELLRELVFTPQLRPTVSAELAAEFTAKRQRLSPGYAPFHGRDLVDWVKERLAVPAREWETLLAAMTRDHGLDQKDILESATERLVRITPIRADAPLTVALETAGRLLKVWSEEEGRPKITRLLSCDLVDPADLPVYEEDEGEIEDHLIWFLGEWLGFYAPISSGLIGSALGVDQSRLAAALEDLIETGRLIAGELITDGPGDDLCDSENFEILLRMARTRAAPAFEPLESKWLPVFLAEHQGLTRSASGSDALADRLEQLLGLPVPAGLWESDLLPARLGPYDPAWLDAALEETGLIWKGDADRKVTFCDERDLDLLADEEEESPPADIWPAELWTDPEGRYDFATLLRRSGLRPEDLSTRLWTAVWEGRLTNDTFLALRRALETDFAAPAVSQLPGSSAGGRGGPAGGAPCRPGDGGFCPRLNLPRTQWKLRSRTRSESGYCWTATGSSSGNSCSAKRPGCAGPGFSALCG